MGMSKLESLNADELLKLGGIRDKCSAPLVCAAHGVLWPCEHCELDGEIEVTCTQCNHIYPQGLAERENRTCASRTEFDRNGKIAFQIEARAALAAKEEERLKKLEQEKSAREKQKRKEAEKVKREAETQRLAKERERSRSAKEAEKARREKDADDRRRAKERLDFERRLDEERKRGAEAKRLTETSPIRTKIEEAEAKAADLFRRAPVRRTLTASVAAVLAGSWMAWNGALIPIQHNGFIFALPFLILTALIWAVGNLPILRPHPAHDALGKWAFLTWAFVSYAWPPFIALMIFKSFEAGDISIKKLSAMAVVGVAGILTMQRGGSALSMSPPWPSCIPEEFKGRRSFWIWCGLILTLFLNLGNLQGRQLHIFDDNPADASADGVETLVVNATALNCRSEPSKDAQRLAKLVNGQNVTVVQPERVDGWVKLNVDDVQCWALGEHLASPE
jgi:hypothetical protein